ncbi:Arc family DNA-binding protein [Streptomyces europaeiscabiei]|uniref:Arc family DNA-binding protein n=1 Tax=Streptomyces europaeiscabiei TaxID=146819 RepID=UPI0029C0C3A2|nr:Arc family DNA-binding protein [Streptomyces europaeiscabiei]
MQRAFLALAKSFRACCCTSAFPAPSHSLRIPDELHARLVSQAETDRRSLNSEILHLLEVALTAVDGDGQSP